MRMNLNVRAECGHKGTPRCSALFEEICPNLRATSRRITKASLVALILWLTVLPGARATVQEHSKHWVTLEDLLSLKVGNLALALSPDGKTLAYAVDEDVWLVSTGPGGVPRKLGKGYIPLWSPQNDRLAYYSSRSGTLQLWVFDLRTNRSEQVTQFAGGIDPDPWARMMGSFSDSLRYSWSPDGSCIVFASRVSAMNQDSSRVRDARGMSGAARKIGTPLILTAMSPAHWTLSGVFAHGFGPGAWRNGKVSWELDPASQNPTAKVNQLFVLSIKTKAVRQLSQDDSGYFHPDWSPDGVKIVCSSSEGKSLEGGSSGTTNIYSIDVATGDKAALTTGSGDKFMPSWSPDGRWIAYRGGEHFQIWHAFVVSSKGGAVTVVSPVDRYVQELQWMADSKSVALMYRDGVTVSAAQVDIQAGVVKMLSGKEAAYRTSLTVSRFDSIAWQENGPYDVSVIRLLRADKDASRVLVDLNPQIHQWQLGNQEVVSWKNHRGDDMEGLLLKPLGYQKGRRYPLIVDAYPMQQNSFKGALSGNQAWASKGYVVFWPNARAPHVWMNAFKSEAFSQVAKGPNGWEVTIDDVMSGVDELIRSGIVDPDRMGLYGFSNGGGIVNYLVTQTNRFKCAVSVAGAVSDWLRLALLETDSKFPDFEGGANPWSDPSPYIQLSAVFRLQNVTTPMLLADGDEDGDFLLNTIEMYNGLRRFGRDVTFLRYPGQGHGFTGAALEDFWARENAFFDKYLKPGTPPQN